MRFRSTGWMALRMLLAGALLSVYAAPGLLPAARDVAHALDHALDNALDNALRHAVIDAAPTRGSQATAASPAAAHRPSRADSARPEAGAASLAHGHPQTSRGHGGHLHEHPAGGPGSHDEEHARAGDHRRSAYTAEPVEQDGPGVHGHDGLAGLLIALAPSPRPDGRLDRPTTPVRLVVDVHHIVRVPGSLPRTRFDPVAGAAQDSVARAADAAEPLTPPPRA